MTATYQTDSPTHRKRVRDFTKASPVIVTRADGSTVTLPTYGVAQLGQVHDGKKAKPSKPSIKQKRAVWLRDRGHCRYCRIPITKRRDDGSLSVVPFDFDHWPIPFALGGTTKIDNLVLSCRRCNRKKQERDLSIFPVPRDKDRIRGRKIRSTPFPSSLKERIGRRAQT